MDAQKWWAETLSERGIRGSFQCVGELVRAWNQQGRDDVIAALEKHEVGCHTNYHSLPPTHPEAVDGLNLAAGIRWIHEREASGVSAILETFKRLPISGCPPGDSWTAPTLLALAELGIPVFCGPPIRLQKRPYWYCGLLMVEYDLAFDRYMIGKDGEDAFKNEFRAIQERVEDSYMVIYTHPCRLVTEQFWDVPLYGRNMPASLAPAPLYEAKTIAAIQDRMKRLLDWILDQPEVRVTDYANLWVRYNRSRRDLSMLLAECGLNPLEAGKLPLREPGEGHQKIAEAIQRSTYKWPLYPEDFCGKELRRQLTGLAWTYQPAEAE